MISFEDALEKILDNSELLDIEEACITDSVGSVLAEDVISGIEMPPFNKSAMDGYAVIVDNLENVPVQLECVGVVEAGTAFTGEVKSGQCVKIMTGAPIPFGANAVVMVEDTDGKALFNKIISVGKNICLKGEDISLNEIVVQKDTLLSTSHIAVIAAVGRAKVKVYRKPKVSIVNTGGEIVPVGTKLSENKIYNSNGPMLSACLKSSGIDSFYQDHARDDEQELKDVFNKALEADIMLISGGVSMGDFDLVPKMLEELGVEEVFYKVAMKPGKPLFFGKKEKTLVFGIPGNPVSNYVAYYLFVLSAIKKSMGNENSSPKFLKGILQKEYKQKRADRKHFIPVVVKEGQVSFVDSHGSADIRRLADADGFMVVEKEVLEISAGQEVSFVTWK